MFRFFLTNPAKVALGSFGAGASYMMMTGSSVIVVILLSHVGGVVIALLAVITLVVVIVHVCIYDATSRISSLISAVLLSRY